MKLCKDCKHCGYNRPTDGYYIVSTLPCLWTRSKFISTCGAVSLESITSYLDGQKGK